MDKSQVKEPHENPIRMIGRLRPGTVQVTVVRDVRLDDLKLALEKIVGLHGCDGCGQNGLDLIFKHSLPINELFRDIKGIANVEVF
jgi:hypothetical protein